MHHSLLFFARMSPPPFPPIIGVGTQAKMNETNKCGKRPLERQLLVDQQKRSTDWSLQTGHSVLQYASNEKLWLRIRGRRVRVTLANGLQQKQRRYNRYVAEKNRWSAACWWEAVWWDTTLAISVHLKTPTRDNLPQQWFHYNRAEVIALIIRLFRCIKAVALGFLAPSCSSGVVFSKGESKVIAARHWLHPMELRKRKKKKKQRHDNQLYWHLIDWNQLMLTRRVFLAAQHFFSTLDLRWLVTYTFVILHPCIGLTTTLTSWPIIGEVLYYSLTIQVLQSSG